MENNQKFKRIRIIGNCTSVSNNKIGASENL